MKIDVEMIAADCEKAHYVWTAKMVKGKAGRSVQHFGTVRSASASFDSMGREKSSSSLWEAPMCKEKLQKSK